MDFKQLLHRLAHLLCCTLLRMAACGLIVMISGVARAEWGGSASGATTESQIDSIRTRAIDQEYRFHFSGPTGERFQYFASIRYRHLQIDTHDSKPTWLSELQPSVEAAWTNPLYTLRGEYVYRDNRDLQKANQLIGKSAGLNLQTSLIGLPQLHGRYQWTQNVNDLDLQGINTRLRSISAGSSYAMRNLSLFYEYNNQFAENPSSGLKRTSIEHEGIFNNTLHFAKKIAILHTSYAITDRSEREVVSASNETLLPILAVFGLYAADPSPEFGVLESAPSLSDGNVEVPVSPQINLSGSDFHNIGLDFGAPASVNHLYLYTDTLANSQLSWAIFTSMDNLNWTQVRGYETAPFSTVFSRYEFLLPMQTARYIKLVDQPLLQNNQILVTELRAFVSRSENTSPDHVTDHRATADLRLQPTSWLSASIGGSLVNTGGGFISLARRQEGIFSNIRAVTAPWLELSGQYQLNRTVYSQSVQARNTSNQWAFTIQSRWLSTLSSRLTLNRQTEQSASNTIRRNDGANFRVQAQWFPALSTTTDFGYLEDHRFDFADIYTTRTYGQSAEGQPTERSSVYAEYRYYNYNARYRSIPAYRETISLRSSYRLTATIYLQAEAQWFHEPSRDNQEWNGLMSWNATPQISISSGVSKLNSEQIDETTLYTLDSMFHWTNKTDLSFSYSYTDYNRNTRPNGSLARAAFSTRL